jgi:hypothetical protein
VKRLESEFAEFVGAPHALAVNSCTAALHLALEALGVRAGDVVLVPTMTFAATAEVVRYLGGIPLRAAERTGDETLVLVGGPTASHPEPIAPFIDAAFIGEAEELLPPVVLAWAALRREIRAGKRTRMEVRAQVRPLGR